MPLPTIPSGNVASALPTGYDVDNSCRFNDGDSPQLSKSVGSSATTKYTLSLWVKRGTMGSYQRFFTSTGGGGLGDTYFRFDTNDILEVSGHGSNAAGGGYVITNRKFRDPSAWMHIVIRYDSTESTANDRFRVYINGVDERNVGGYSTDTMPNSSVADNITASGNTIRIGASASAQYFDGYLAEIHFSEGQSYAPTEFGEYDDDSPTIWKPKEASISYGTSGFYLDFKDSSNLGNDANGGTDLSETNLAAADQATDTPTNNFATWNPLFKTQNSGTFSEGNCINTSSTNAWGGTGSTFGLSKGKWFWEAKINFSNLGGHFVGVIDESLDVDNSSSGPHQQTGSTLFYPASGGQMYKDGSGSGSYGTFSAGQVMGFALNLDDDEISIYQNGSAIVTDYALSTTKNTLFVWGMAYTSGSDFVQVNFGGCPPFSISSGNSDANGYGNFEYAVPSGYYAICTKNLAEFG